MCFMLSFFTTDGDVNTFTYPGLSLKFCCLRVNRFKGACLSITFCIESHNSTINNTINAKIFIGFCFQVVWQFFEFVELRNFSCNLNLYDRTLICSKKLCLVLWSDRIFCMALVGKCQGLVEAKMFFRDTLFTRNRRKMTNFFCENCKVLKFDPDYKVGRYLPSFSLLLFIKSHLSNKLSMKE